MKEIELSWFGHVRCMPANDLLRRSDVMEDDNVKMGGGDKKMWMEFSKGTSY